MIGLSPHHLVSEVIRPTLRHLGDKYDSPAAQQLLLGTAIVESNLHALYQYNGPARGLWQMEPNTHTDHRKWLLRHTDLAAKIRELEVFGLSAETQIAGNLYYACAMARVHYWRVTEPLPEANDISGLGRYWKAHYNTPAGKGTVNGFILKWHEAVD